MTPACLGRRYIRFMHARASLCAFALLAGCAGAFDPIGPGDDPFGDFTPPPEVTPAPPIVVQIAPSQLPLRRMDGGFVATNEGQSWSQLETLGGGEAFSVASTIEVVGSIREWMLPGDGSDPSSAETGIYAGYVAEAIANGRYAAIRVTAGTAAELPDAWVTTADPPGFVPDGRISLLSVGDPTGDDDDSSGDDDDSAGDDDDDSAGGREVTDYLDWTDPDLFQLHGAVAQSLGDRFADGPGLAFVTVGGPGLDGLWRMPEDLPGVGLGGPFTEGTWFSTVGLYTELYRGAFAEVPAFIAWTVLRDAGANAEALLSTLDGDEVALRDPCFGGCTEYDWARFPGEDGEPYPSSDPYGGWVPGDAGRDLFVGGGLGGIGGWRRSEVSGGWDDATFGSTDEHLDRTLDVGQRHAPLRWVALGDTACLSAWAVAASPSGGSCDAQSGVWGDLAKWQWSDGDRPAVGARPELRRVSLAGNWVELGEFDLELQWVNAGSAAVADRTWEVRFVGSDGAVLLVDSILVGALDPGSTLTIERPFVVEGVVSPGEVRIEVRVPDARAFDGVMPLALPDSSDGWSLAATVPGL